MPAGRLPTIPGLLYNQSISRFGNDPIATGKLPESWLSFKVNFSRFDRSPIALLILPVKLFSSKYRVLSALILKMDDGNCPFKRFLCISMIDKFPRVLKSAGIGPLKLFSERDKDVITPFSLHPTPNQVQTFILPIQPSLLFQFPPLVLIKRVAAV